MPEKSKHKLIGISVSVTTGHSVTVGPASSCLGWGWHSTLLGLTAYVCRGIPGLCVHSCDRLGRRALAGLKVIVSNTCCPCFISRVAQNTPSLAGHNFSCHVNLSLNTAPGRGEVGRGTLSLWPISGYESRGPCACPPHLCLSNSGALTSYTGACVPLGSSEPMRKHRLGIRGRLGGAPAAASRVGV